MRPWVKTVLLAGAAVLLLGVIAYLPHLVTLYQRWQQEQEWQRLDAECADHHLFSCGLLAARVSPACTREGKPNACYHLAILLDRGFGVVRNTRQVAEYFRMACGAGIQHACFRMDPR